MAMTGRELKIFVASVILSTCVPCPAFTQNKQLRAFFYAYICRSEAILLNWVTPFIPIACLVKGAWGKKGCVMSVH